MPRRLSSALAHRAALLLAAVCAAASPAWAYDVQLAWSPAAGAAGYRAYVRPSGQSFDAGTDLGAPAPGSDGRLRAVLSGLASGPTYGVALTAYAADGSESGLSNELTLSLAASPTATATWTPTVAAPPSPSATRTPSSTPTPSPSASVTATRTASPTASDTATPPPSATSTASASPTPTRTASPTRTATSSATATRTETETPPPSATATASATRSATASPSATPTHSATRTATSTDTVPPSSTTTATATRTDTAAPTTTSTNTPSRSATPTPTETHTPPATGTATASATRTETAAPTATSSSTPSRSATATRSATPTRTAPPSPSATASPSPSRSATRTSTPSPSPSPSATPTPAWNLSLPADARALPGALISLPLAIDAGSGIQRLAARIAYDSELVAVQGAQLLGDGTLTADLATPGLLRLDVALPRPLLAGGTLAEVQLLVVGACPATTSLRLEACTLDGGALACAPHDGSLAIRCGVGGRVSHWATGAAVRGTTVSLRGTARVVQATTTDALGQFAFASTSAGPVRLDAQKDGDLRGAVSALDAALVLRAIVSGATLDARQLLACDVTGNGLLSTLDAARILQFAVGATPHLPVADTCASDWVFIPAPASMPNQSVIAPQPGETTCERGSIELASTLDDAPAQDFLAVPLGDCSGNWTAPAAGAALRGGADLRVWLGTARPRPGGEWLVPVYADADAPFTALELRLRVDAGARLAHARTAGGARGAALQYARTDDGAALAIATGTSITADARPVALLVIHSRATPHARLLSARIDDVPVPRVEAGIR
ncbi:MAG: hypothetical protein SF182_04485 [Deltaproteobacteria bacterium]|nr:hypothetical protein [Deltaproteobacteria bacterium]